MKGFKTIYRDIEIRGVVYPTLKAAAQALGVTHGAVLKAFHAGTLDRVGLGIKGMAGLPVSVRGEVFPNAIAAAKKFGVTKARIYSALSEGDIDRIGRERQGGAKAIPFEIGELRWPSRRAASIDLGFRSGYVQAAFQKDLKNAQQCILGAAMKLAALRGAANQRRAA